MKRTFSFLILLVSCILPYGCSSDGADVRELSEAFVNPPLEARPGVYWYFMDGNLSREGITKDLEAMKEAGIGYVVFLEVNVGVPRGDVDFMSEEWCDIFAYAVDECRRLDIQMVLGIGPGWTGSGGPWVEGSGSMRHIVSSKLEVEGGRTVSLDLPVPEPHEPYFGEDGFTPQMQERWENYYEDIAMLALPAQEVCGQCISDIDEKALYVRAPYSSVPGVKQYLPSPAEASSQFKGVPVSSIVDLTGKSTWDVPEGRWVIMRFGSRNNGAVTRPAPLPGVGMECDKFSSEALHEHLSHFTDRLFEKIGDQSGTFGGVKYLHMDSWEMGAQNWTDSFREEFLARRGYDPLPFYPVTDGIIVGDAQLSERFLWDLRQTAQELVLEKHSTAVREYAHRHGCMLSIEPYDMTPLADMELAVTADIPMAEFWSDGYGFNTSFAPVEGTSAAHIIGQSVVPAESFTSQFDGYRQYPGSIKAQTDWAFAQGINRLMFHTFQHQCLPDSLLPGMTMGPYGVHWDRNQTWWTLSSAYHKYVARCQFMLQQGRTQADILYLCPETAPFVFKAPESALVGPDGHQPDRRGYNFDACPPGMLYRTTVDDGGRICFPGGAKYRVLVLPDYPTMTPEMLMCISSLVKEGATVIGNPPSSSPGLQNWPECDEQVKKMAGELWRKGDTGKGRVFTFGEADNLYQPYDETSEILEGMGMIPDFVSDSEAIRYTHRTDVHGSDMEIYFVSNRSLESVDARCIFRVSGLVPQLWNPMTGKMTGLPCYEDDGSSTSVPLHFECCESYFIVFSSAFPEITSGVNYRVPCMMKSIEGPWKLDFNGLDVSYPALEDWALSADERIRYYSGKVRYHNSFIIDEVHPECEYLLDLGDVQVAARVTINGVEAGIAWTKPFRVDITPFIRQGDNTLEVEVANLWINRLIGDDRLPDGISGSTFTTYRHHCSSDSLVPSGLLGPVSIYVAGKP